MSTTVDVSLKPPAGEIPPPGRWKRRPHLVSIVCPVFQEAEGIAFFVESLLGVMDGLDLPYEVLFVEDDSSDGTLEILKELQNQRPAVLKILSMSRRFGHQHSLAAGFQYSRGNVVICMDSDMQHPPALLPEMLYHWSEGYQLVYTRRRSQVDRGFLKETASRWFYRLMDLVSETSFEEGTADFRLMDEVVASSLKQFGERDLFFRGLVNWVGFRRMVVEYDAEDRHAGNSSYSWWRMLQMGIDSLFAFSLVPLRLGAILGSVLMLACWLYGLFTLFEFVTGSVDVPGYTTLVLLLVFLGSLNLITLGIVGEYVGRIHEQVKQRPLYLIKEWVGFDDVPRPGKPGSPERGPVR